LTNDINSSEINESHSIRGKNTVQSSLTNQGRKR
jgi:hypothetical protein